MLLPILCAFELKVAHSVLHFIIVLNPLAAFPRARLY